MTDTDPGYGQFGTARIGTVVDTSNAPQHSGSGHIFHLVNQATAPRRVARTYDRRSEQRLAERFVAPDGFETARSVLDAGRTLLVRGEPGTGRLACAVVLLSGHGGEGCPSIRMLDPRDASPEDELILPEDLAGSARLLLDLSGLADPAGPLRLVNGLVDEVRAQGATVVVVLPAGSVRQDNRVAAFDVRRPDGGEVLRRHLTASGLPSGSSPDLPRELLDFARNARMAEIENLASVVEDARSADPTGSLAEWAEAALTVANQDEEATGALRAEPNRRVRTLALAASVFEGCSDETVLRAERRLIEAVGLPPDQDHELTGTDLGHRLDTVGAGVRDGAVRFTGLHRAVAVRQYFWSQFPALRDGFHRWTVESAGLGVRSGLGIEIATRYAEPALRAGRQDLVADAVQHWAPRDRQPVLAAAALQHGLADNEHGAYFRRRCYGWATTVTLPVDLAQLVVSACVDVMAETYPGQAVVRLHHLTRHREPEVATAAQDGLATVLADGFALRRFVVRVSDPSRVDRRAELRLFVAVVRPEPLVAGMSDLLRERVSTCWAAVLRRLSTEEYEPSVRRWLTAQTRQLDDDPLIRVLVHGADRRGLAALHGITHRWLAEPVPDEDGRRRAVARRMVTEIGGRRRTTRTADTERDDSPR